MLTESHSRKPSRSPEPVSKKIKLSPEVEDTKLGQAEERERVLDEEAEDLEEEEDHCTICLQTYIDRTVVPTCSHEFCFECLLIWTDQSRRCPICVQAIGEYVIHNIRSRYDYQKHYLAPLQRASSSEPQMLPLRTNASRNPPRRRIPREIRERSRRERQQKEEEDRFERAVAKRKWLYKYDLYAKHVASNGYTRYRPYPTPAQFAASKDLISRTTVFLRRELLVWPDLDIEFLTTFIISLMKAIDIRSESAVKLLAEFLDMDAPYVEGRRHVNAEHFAHEVYSYVRSPYPDLFVYDDVVQYDDPPEDFSPPPSIRGGHGRNGSNSWRIRDEYSQHDRSPPLQSLSRSPSPLPGRRRKSSRRSRPRSSTSSVSWSPSGRRYADSRRRERDLSLSPGAMGERDSHSMPLGNGRDSNQSRIRSTRRSRSHNRGASRGRADRRKDRSGSPEISRTGKEDRGDDGSKWGGKAKADGEVQPPPESSSEPRRAVPEASDLKVSYREDEHRNSKQPPKTRNRSLLESVQAHLGSSSGSGVSAISKQAVDGSRPKPHRPPDARRPEKPSLLSRLKDTRINSGPNQESRMDDVPAPPPLTPPVSRSGSDTPAESELSHKSSDTRMKLLQKLVQEKRKVDNGKVGGGSGEEDDTVASASSKQIDVLDSNAGSEQREAKLRMRARLQSRLASEKRAGIDG